MQKRSCNPPKKREKSKSTGIRECYIRKLEPLSAKTKTSPCSVMWAVTKVHTIVGEIRGPDEQLMETDEKTQIKRNLRTHKKNKRSERGHRERRGMIGEWEETHTHTLNTCKLQKPDEKCCCMGSVWLYCCAEEWDREALESFCVLFPRHSLANNETILSRKPVRDTFVNCV